MSKDLGLRRITRALVSVYDKTGIVEFTRGLSKWEVEILSTGTTATVIAAAGLKVREVSKYTGFPELFDGRLKTIHPKIAGGILYMRDNESHVDQAHEHEIPPIDLVVVNLYDFEETVAKSGTTLAEAIEKIDIGGPTMIRAAGKNFESVVVVVRPGQHNSILEEMSVHEGCLTRATRFHLLQEAFKYTAAYDTAIQKYLLMAKLS